eukprot:GABV01000988.1.p1 GENE.GABV01000988.1~~GABV01000988.1.p1  ORF type:complete len:238 (-),score=66.86 GABV01000988.1:76-789(-)
MTQKVVGLLKADQATGAQADWIREHYQDQANKAESPAATAVKPTLIKCIYDEDIKQLESLLADKEEAQKQLEAPDTRTGATPLLLAIEKGQIDAVRLLIAAGASTNAKYALYSKEGPMELAKRFGWTSIVEELSKTLPGDAPIEQEPVNEGLSDSWVEVDRHDAQSARSRTNSGTSADASGDAKENENENENENPPSTEESNEVAPAAVENAEPDEVTEDVVVKKKGAKAKRTRRAD